MVDTETRYTSSEPQQAQTRTTEALNITHPLYSYEGQLRLDAFPKGRPGAYIVRLWDTARDAPTPVSRLNGHDEGGILYIGGSDKCCAGRLSARARDAVLSRFNGGWTFQLTGIRLLLPGTDAAVLDPNCLRFEIGENPRGLEMEAELLQTYMQTYWEFPPLNFGRPTALTEKMMARIKAARAAARLRDQE